ncbi:MAG: hypothetical protein KJ697_01855 [Nanoarchaeota archaeon]|nr:hypothetical protein [Nanoarchaeota archaeon]
MSDYSDLEKKAKNYFILGLFGEKHKMTSEAVSNYFKALFAICDMFLIKKTGFQPKDHTERFRALERTDKFLYRILDELFSVYRETYTKELSPKRVEHIRKRIGEIFDYAKIEKPTEKDL